MDHFLKFIRSPYVYSIIDGHYAARMPLIVACACESYIGAAVETSGADVAQVHYDCAQVVGRSGSHTEIFIERHSCCVFARFQLQVDN